MRLTSTGKIVCGQREGFPARLLLVALVLFAGQIAFASDPADSPAPDDVDPGVWEQIERMYDQARAAGEQVPADVYEWVRQDLQSVGDWEYRVLDLDGGDAASTEKNLNELGADRWECIWIQRKGSKVRFFMKRPRRSYLGSLPVSQLIKLLPTGTSD